MVKKVTKKKIVAPPSRLYRRIAFSFLAVAVILLAVALSFSFSRATIVIKPKKEALSTQLSVDVRKTPAEGEIQGRVFERVIKTAKTFAVKGDQATTIATRASGTVKLINTTSRSQPLVKTTRLLSKEGVLFRTDESVVVPATGSVEVLVHADQPGTSGEIGPSRFTIPGLWEGLQDKIYGESDASMCCGTESRRVITEEDLAAAETELVATMIKEGMEKLRADEPDEAALQGEIILTEITEKKSSAPVGSEQTEFTISLTVGLTAVFYDRGALETMVRETLRDLAGAERELVELDPSRVIVTAERVDVRTEAARLRVEATGLLVLRPDSGIFKKERLFSLDAAAVEAYFKTFHSVESVQIQFSLPWQTKIPRFKDQIEIRIQE
ncbi:MAG: hypothetical protein Q8P82_02140 [bacterium]|nr:hypothetical protein [bacterium]